MNRREDIDVVVCRYAVVVLGNIEREKEWCAQEGHAWLTPVKRGGLGRGTGGHVWVTTVVTRQDKEGEWGRGS
jgi:hypothetical protein